MLNWDEYSKEENTAPPSVTTETVTATPAPVQQVVEPTPVVAQDEGPDNYSSKVIEEGSRAEKAREAVLNLDEAAGIEELDEMMGERVQVDQKMMINWKPFIGGV